MLMTSIRHCLKNLTNFSGRDPRRLFWPYTLTVIGLSIAIWVPVYTFQMTTRIVNITNKMDAFAKENPDKVTYGEGATFTINAGENVPGLTANFSALFNSALITIAVVFVIVFILLAAAVTRRLHDIGKRGWVGAIPPVLFLFSLFLFINVVDMILGFQNSGVQDNTSNSDPEILIGYFFLNFLTNFVYLISLVVLIVLLCQRSQQGYNRFGSA